MTMRRTARVLGPGRIRVLGGLGGLLACGAAGVAVAAGPRPAGAPLKPPVDPAAPLGGVAHADAAGTGGLVIPATPVCGGAAAAGTALDPSLRSVIARLRAAPTRAQRLAILQALSPDQRQQVSAYLRSRARGAGQAAGPAHCTPGAGAGSSASAVPVIQPDVVDGSPSQAPVSNSYVS
jgi:hypothetical protein